MRFNALTAAYLLNFIIFLQKKTTKKIFVLKKVILLQNIITPLANVCSILDNEHTFPKGHIFIYFIYERISRYTDSGRCYDRRRLFYQTL